MERVANKIGCFQSQVNPHFISAPALSFCWEAVRGGAYFHSPIQRMKTLRLETCLEEKVLI